MAPGGGECLSGRVTTLLVRALLVALVLAPAVAVAAGGVPELPRARGSWLTSPLCWKSRMMPRCSCKR